MEKTCYFSGDNSYNVVMQYTVEGFEIHIGDVVYVARLVEHARPILRSRKEDGSVEDKEQAPKKVWDPAAHTVTEGEDLDRCWRRHHECHTYCEALNRAL